MSLKINRRDFLKVIFKTTSAIAVSGTIPYWPTEALSRPVMDPVIFSDDGYGYLIDANADYYDLTPPTFREWLNLEGLTLKQLSKHLKEEEWRFEHPISHTDERSVAEVQEWLESDVELNDMGLWEAMSYTPYGPPISFYDELSSEDADQLGLYLIEGDTPGSSFAGVQAQSKPQELNRELQKLGINVQVK
jgi:hypothetical protein